MSGCCGGRPGRDAVSGPLGNASVKGGGGGTFVGVHSAAADQCARRGASQTRQSAHSNGVVHLSLTHCLLAAPGLAERGRGPMVWAWLWKSASGTRDSCRTPVHSGRGGTRPSTVPQLEGRLPRRSPASRNWRDDFHVVRRGSARAEGLAAGPWSAASPYAAAGMRRSRLPRRLVTARQKRALFHRSLALR
jgi:hypothetical protein